jgi:hypothetical protein
MIRPTPAPRGPNSEAKRSAGPAAPSPAAPAPPSAKVKEPRKTRYVTPVYPEVAIGVGVEGAVVLECNIRLK